MSQGQLLSQRRFAPFFATQFLGAFNDLLFKQSLVILFAMHASSSSGGADRDGLANAAGALFIFPYFLFSATAGELADRYEKSWLIRRIKVFEICVMLLAAVGLFFMNRDFLLFVLFLLGTQAAFFGPVKLAILPQVLKTEELVGGNGLIEMGTYVAILGGTILGGVLGSYGPSATSITAISVVVVAFAGYAMSRLIPRVHVDGATNDSPVVRPDVVIHKNALMETWRTVQMTREVPSVFLSVLGNGWFWAFGSIFLNQLPGFSQDVLGGDASAVTLLLILFSLGVGIGSMLCERLSSGHIELGLVPFGALGMTFFSVDLYFATRGLPRPSQILNGFQIATSWVYTRTLFDFALLGVFGGFYSVPLFAIIQHRSPAEKRSRVIGGLNILTALFIVVSSVFAVFVLHPEAFGFAWQGASIPHLFLIAGVLNAVVALYIFLLLPEFLLRFLTWLMMRTMYRLGTKGTENIPESGAALLVCNHISYVDAFILSAGIRRPVRFVMWYKFFEMPVLRWLFRVAKCIPIAGRKENSELMERAFAAIDRALAEGELVCIFPEGALTHTGDIAEFRPGTDRILSNRKVAVIPMALRGLWGSWFSREGGGAIAKTPRRFRAHIELAVGQSIAVDHVDQEASADKLRELVLSLRGDKK